MRTWTREDVAGFLEQLAAAAQPPALPPHRLHRHAARRVAESSVVGCSLEHQHDLRSNPGGADGGGRQGVRWTTWRNPPSRGLAAGRLRSTTRASTSFSGTASRNSSSGRAPSSVSREVARNAAPGATAPGRLMLPPAAEPDVPSRASWCSCHASGDRRGPSGASLIAEQIAAWLRRTCPGDLEMRVSHDTIYLSLFVQTRGALRRDAALRY